MESGTSITSLLFREINYSENTDIIRDFAVLATTSNGRLCSYMYKFYIRKRTIGAKCERSE